ncbi:MAG: hypothetical protein ABS39_08125 [Acidovorax sp. SCN 65-28]|nr:MAG: hypothetical protein ABS39_08125 [Acidovorax sp. SCN 65-28]
MHQVWPLRDDVEIQPAVPVSFKLCDMVGHLLTGARRTPHCLAFINNDDGAIGHSVGPGCGVIQGHMGYRQVRDAMAINGAVFSQVSEHSDQGRRFSRARSTGN